MKSCYIDGQNLYQALKSQDIQIDWYKFRKYLLEKYKINHAFFCVGYFEDNYKLYKHLQLAGFIIYFKPVTVTKDGLKGNVDGDLIAIAMDDLDKYEEVSLVSNDGDYHRFIEILSDKKKLGFVFSPDLSKSSKLLRQKAGKKIINLLDAKHIFEYKK